MIKLSDYVMKFIAAQGVREVFMLPGGGCMHLVESLGNNKDLRFICNLHEQACAIAADACAQYRNGLGVALVTTGPGGTNAITGVAGSWLDSIPVLMLSGQVKRDDLCEGKGIRQMGFQEIQIVKLVQPIVKYAAVVMDSAMIRYHLEKAVFLARAGRPGPVWLDIPLDVQAAMIDETGLKRFNPAEEGLVAKPVVPELRRQVAHVLDLLGQAQRPVILAGNGIRLAGALDSFDKVVRILGAPVLLTWKAIDFLAEEDPLYAGRPGAIGQRAANFAIQNADFVLAIGARLDHGQTGYSHINFARGAVKVMVDVDVAEIDKMMMPVAEKVAADAYDFLAELLKQVSCRPVQEPGAWLARCKEWQRQYPLVTQENWNRTDAVDLYVLIEVLSELMSPGDLLIPGSSGQCSELTMQAFKVKCGQRIFNTEGLGPMGFGLPAAIGGCVASGGRKTICLDGDGGVQMNIQELETLHRLQVPVKLFVLNNQGYGSIRISQKNYFNGHYVASDESSGLSLPDICKLASAYGLSTSRLTSHEGIRDRIREILAAPGPFVCDVVVPKDQPTSPKLSSFQKKDGSMGSRPLEDLWPFLDRDEFQSNMIVPSLED
jgi:acetolactate synthase-1/2/3 large subunit